MLFYKSWLETRWRFAIGLLLLAGSAVEVVFIYPKVMQLMPLVPMNGAGGELGRRIREGAALASTYRGYVWSQWMRQNLTQMGTLFAVLLGTGGLVPQGSRGAALFTLSLPASRSRLVGVRAAAGLAEFFVLAFVPCLLIPLLSPAVGESYASGSAIVHGLCAFVAGAVFFSLALLLSTVFGDLWRPLLITCTVAAALALCEPFVPGLARYGLFQVMSGAMYFRSGVLPWGGLGTSAAVTLALLYAARINFARHDF